ncbi:MAG: DoxX family protein [Chloroflexi bacterium]|nr:DoxX family protein [Chloroflexota bacterium]
MTLNLLSVVVALAALLYGAVKIRLIPAMFRQARTLGVRYPQFRLLGVIEVVLAILVVLGIWAGWVGTIGSLLLTVVMSVLIVLHARANDVPMNYIAPAALGILSFILFLVHVYT